MKYFTAWLLCLILLTGCSADDLDTAISLRQKLQNSNGCRFTCEITADYGDSLYSFQLNCTTDPIGEMSFEVVSPDTIRGIRGSIRHTGGKLTFEDQILAFPLLADGYLSPISAPWLMIKALLGGYMSSCYHDQSGYCVTINDTFSEETMQVDIWLDSNGDPAYSQILWDSKRILSMSVRDFGYL